MRIDGDGEQLPLTPVRISFDLPVVSATKPRGNNRWADAVSATFGPFTVTDHSRAKVRETMESAVRGFLEDWHAPEMVHFRGVSVVVHVRPCEMGVVYGYDTYTDARQLSSCTTGGTWEETMTSARRHLAMYTIDYHDDASVAETWRFLESSALTRSRLGDSHGFISEVCWQRAMRAAQDAGETNHDLAQWGYDHGNEFLPAVRAALAGHELPSVALTILPG